jgi:predicted kinase
MYEVVILRGIPGSGKSTRAEEAYSGHEVCSADDYFRNFYGVYKFDARALPAAHRACLLKFEALLIAGTEHIIVVDNTNLTAAEIAPYYALAEAHGYDPRIEDMNPGTVKAIARQAGRRYKAVPPETIERMAHLKAAADPTLPARWVRHSFI